MIRITEGKTFADLAAALKAMKPGNYAAVCFLEDAQDHKPHFMHGMTQAITIS